MTGHADDVFVFPYDPGKAKELLKEAGYENGFETTLYFPMDPIVMREVTIVQENLKDVGIKVNVRQLAWPTYLDMTEKEGKCPMFASGWIADYNDPAAFMAPLYHSRNWGPGGNIAFYKNEVVDKLLDEIMITADPEERTELCKEAQKIIAEDTPYAFTFTREELHCAGVWVKDFVAQPLGLIDLHPVYKE
jgi:peptide/nickel transport system substrate-binding protein